MSCELKYRFYLEITGKCAATANARVRSTAEWPDAADAPLRVRWRRRTARTFRIREPEASLTATTNFCQKTSSSIRPEAVIRTPDPMAHPALESTDCAIRSRTTIPDVPSRSTRGFRPDWNRIRSVFLNLFELCKFDQSKLILNWVVEAFSSQCLVVPDVAISWLSWHQVQ